MAVLTCFLVLSDSMALLTATTTATHYGSGLGSCHKASSSSGKALAPPEDPCTLCYLAWVFGYFNALDFAQCRRVLIPEIRKLPYQSAFAM